MVLEARTDAEKIWYPIVWEETKDANNIIDYNIRKEQTIEQSSVFDANNNTTTGMATVIPWVNAPKLKMSTSIVFDEDIEIIIPTINEKLTATWSTINRPWQTSTAINNMSISDNYWNTGITYYASPQWYYYSWMKIPVEWYYQFEVTYPWTSSSYWWTIQWRTPNWWWSADTIWRTYSTAWNASDEYETFVRHFSEWEVFCLFVTMNRNSSTPISDAPVVTMKVTKL